MIRRPPRSTLFPTRRSSDLDPVRVSAARAGLQDLEPGGDHGERRFAPLRRATAELSVRVAAPAVGDAGVRNPARESVPRAERCEGKVPAHGCGLHVGSPVARAELTGRVVAPAIRDAARGNSARVTRTGGHHSKHEAGASWIMADHGEQHKSRTGPFHAVSRTNESLESIRVTSGTSSSASEKTRPTCGSDFGTGTPPPR